MSACSANCASRSSDVSPRSVLASSTNWKLSKRRCGSLSSNSCILCHGPSPTPTMTMASGTSDARTMASTVACSCAERRPSSVSALRVTCPSAMRSRMWKLLPLRCTRLAAISTAGAKEVGPASFTKGAISRYRASACSSDWQGAWSGLKLKTWRSCVLASPKPKQGMSPSSSMDRSVLPTIPMACSYGLGTSAETSCRLRL
mmetsp:Transcript_6627/g.24602  ORF Transcript_6627/g.24602 Transcript_6627/m.24602 type:complete len:202 (+) Transcript_6627:546-1151(+)